MQTHSLARSWVLATTLALAACAGGQRMPSDAQTSAGQAPASDSVNSYETFEDALTVIGRGDVPSILGLRQEPTRPETVQFLNGLYARYGRVLRIHALVANDVGDIHRGIFMAAHQGGPFFWELEKAGDRYTVVRGTTESPRLLEGVTPPDEAVAAARRFIDRISAGETEAAFEEIVCNCIRREDFEAQARGLREHGGAEQERRLIGAESVPGLEDRLVTLHFLSRRANGPLGFHIVMWRPETEWRVNSVQWSQDDLIPARPLRP